MPSVRHGSRCALGVAALLIWLTADAAPVCAQRALALTLPAEPAYVSLSGAVAFGFSPYREEQPAWSANPVGTVPRASEIPGLCRRLPDDWSATRSPPGGRPMVGTWRLGTASMVLATVWTMAGHVAKAQLAPLPLIVAIHDYAALPLPVLERAKGVATKIYGRIGVSLRWLEDSQAAAALPTNTAACPDSPTPLIHLRLLGRSPNPHRPTGDLGFAASGGTLASVLVERVKYVAKSKSKDSIVISKVEASGNIWMAEVK